MPIIDDGTKTVTTAGVPERLVNQRIGPVAELQIQALSGNSGVVYVGTRNVSSTRGTELNVTSSLGDILTIKNQEPFEVWLDVSINAEGVKWLAME